MSSLTVASRAVLALFKTGAWRALKTHGAETRAENARHNLSDEAKVQVRICSHPSLVAIIKLHGEARTAHYRLTLPAADDGLRLLAGQLQMEHSRTMREYGDRHETLVAEFVAAYGAERDSAPARLNGLYLASQWPSSQEVKTRFKFCSRYLPVPVMGQWDEWLNESAEQAEGELKSRLADAVTKLAHKLAMPDSVFRDTLLSNLTDICSLAGDLNLRDDPIINQVTQQSKQLVAEVTLDQLRDDATIREMAAARAASIAGLFQL